MSDVVYSIPSILGSADADEAAHVLADIEARHWTRRYWRWLAFGAGLALLMISAIAAIAWLTAPAAFEMVGLAGVVLGAIGLGCAGWASYDASNRLSGLSRTWWTLGLAPGTAGHLLVWDGFAQQQGPLPAYPAPPAWLLQGRIENSFGSDVSRLAELDELISALEKGSAATWEGFLARTDPIVTLLARYATTVVTGVPTPAPRLGGRMDLNASRALLYLSDPDTIQRLRNCREAVDTCIARIRVDSEHPPIVEAEGRIVAEALQALFEPVIVALEAEIAPQRALVESDRLRDARQAEHDEHSRRQLRVWEAEGRLQDARRRGELAENRLAQQREAWRTYQRKLKRQLRLDAEASDVDPFLLSARVRDEQLARRASEGGRLHADSSDVDPDHRLRQLSELSRVLAAAEDDDRRLGAALAEAASEVKSAEILATQAEQDRVAAEEADKTIERRDRIDSDYGKVVADLRIHIDDLQQHRDSLSGMIAAGHSRSTGDVVDVEAAAFRRRAEIVEACLVRLHRAAEAALRASRRAADDLSRLSVPQERFPQGASEFCVPVWFARRRLDRVWRPVAGPDGVAPRGTGVVLRAGPASELVLRIAHRPLGMGLVNALEGASVLMDPTVYQRGANLAHRLGFPKGFVARLAARAH